MKVVVRKDGKVDPPGAAVRVGTFMYEWKDRTQYRIFYCQGCTHPFTADDNVETVHDCPGSDGR